MTTTVLPDAEGAVKAWIVGLSIPALGRHIFLGWPKTTVDPATKKPRKPPLPLAIVQRYAGGNDDYVAVDYPQIQLDFYSADRREAFATAAAVAAEIDALDDGTRMGDVAYAGGGRTLLGPVFRPDDDRALARYLVTAEFALKPLSG